MAVLSLFTLAALLSLVSSAPSESGNVEPKGKQLFLAETAEDGTMIRRREATPAETTRERSGRSRRSVAEGMTRYHYWSEPRRHQFTYIPEPVILDEPEPEPEEVGPHPPGPHETQEVRHEEEGEEEHEHHEDEEEDEEEESRLLHHHGWVPQNFGVGGPDKWRPGRGPRPVSVAPAGPVVAHPGPAAAHPAGPYRHPAYPLFAPLAVAGLVTRLEGLTNGLAVQSSAMDGMLADLNQQVTIAAQDDAGLGRSVTLASPQVVRAEYAGHPTLGLIGVDQTKTKVLVPLHLQQGQLVVQPVVHAYNYVIHSPYSQ